MPPTRFHLWCGFVFGHAEYKGVNEISLRDDNCEMKLATRLICREIYFISAVGFARNIPKCDKMAAARLEILAFLFADLSFVKPLFLSHNHD